MSNILTEEEQDLVSSHQSLTPEFTSEQDEYTSEEPLTPIPTRTNSFFDDKDSKDSLLLFNERNVLSSERQTCRSTTPLTKTNVIVSIEKETRWCQRCGTIKTPRWRRGPAGLATLCNACHLRWKARGRPMEGYSSDVFPPPYYNASSLKRNGQHKQTNNTKKQKTTNFVTKTKSIVSKGNKKSLVLNTKPGNDNKENATVSSDKSTIIQPGICCSNCHTTQTPLWRKGSLGLRTLCNACGLKYAKKLDLSLVVKEPKNANTSISKKGLNDILIHHKKEYIQHGLYYDKTRKGSNGLQKAQFSFPLPMHQGEFIISKQIDFKLPADILQEQKLGMIKGITDNRPPFFTRIRSNIFVERKPQTGHYEAAICQCVPPSSPDQVGCGEDCINRMLFYECEPKYCPCGERCSNQRFQRKEKIKGLQVFQTENRGWGLRTLIDIKKGELVTEYRGEVISQELCEERMSTFYANAKNFYFLDYSNGEVIDACTKGTEARFINHSCDPNCHIEKWSLRGESHFGVFASKDIKANSELFYDYNFSTFNGSVKSQQPCYCESKSCRGTIGKKASNRAR
ncbi:MAG: hypothetical protein EXX96DRAFT_27658 [Benjaminiella poitrasii]|nr:MAG: hypothetical protein EXX96DRAFT_27658 [Benjaminiella poitrasii]